ncbi:hypothetical protein ACSBOB_06310 [Mesorhizobium sp. ASY16-5R]|uniref:hypothetical protein n=1 Tax=Mesorhizobium sp. ASY16-5R TaxID=3445772 RepID=UPI003F9ED866
MEGAAQEALATIGTGFGTVVLLVIGYIVAGLPGNRRRACLHGWFEGFSPATSESRPGRLPCARPAYRFHRGRNNAPQFCLIST